MIMRNISAEAQQSILPRELSTILKGIAILLVFVCHLGGRFPVLTRLATPLGGIGVSIFLILSLYGLEKSYQKHVKAGESGLKDYWKNRFLSVWVLYALVEVIALPLHISKGGIAILMDFTIIRPLFGLGWYLNYLWLWYVVFWGVKLLAKKYQKNDVSIFATITMVLMIYFFFTSSFRFEQSFSPIIGIIIAKTELQDLKKHFQPRNGIALLSVAVIALFVKQVEPIRSSIPQVQNIFHLIIKTSASMGIIICICSVWLRSKDCYIFKAFEILGSHSYELYLAHGYALLLFNILNANVAVLLFIFASIVGTMVLYNVNEWIRKKLKPVLFSGHIISIDNPR